MFIVEVRIQLLTVGPKLFSYISHIVFLIIAISKEFNPELSTGSNIIIIQI